MTRLLKLIFQTFQTKSFIFLFGKNQLHFWKGFSLNQALALGGKGSGFDSKWPARNDWGTPALNLVFLLWILFLTWSRRGRITTSFPSESNLRLLQITRLTFRVQNKQMNRCQPRKMSIPHFQSQLDWVRSNPATICVIQMMAKPPSSLT